MNAEVNATKLAVAGVKGLQPYQPGMPVDELERELGIEQAIKLASNENPLGASPQVIATLKRLATDLSRYPDANGYQLKQALASFHRIETKQITLGNGSNDILDLIARVFVSPGQSVIFSEYAFLVYPLVTRLVGGQASVVPAIQWGHDLDAMLEAVNDNSRLVMIANPNNPTGTCLKTKTVQSFLDQCPDHVIVVIDEAYHDYVESNDYQTALDYLSNYPNLIVTRTFSKVYGLASLRVGYGVGSAEITDFLNRARQPFNVNGLAQIAALQALQDQNHVEQSKQVNLRQMKRLIDVLEKWKIPYIPSAGNFLSVEFGAQASVLYQRLLSRGVIVRPLDNYAMPHHLRITIGSESENDRLIAELSNLLDHQSRS